ncbi:MAG: SDR family oxidoreductase [Pseudomonadota bacterium]
MPKLSSEEPGTLLTLGHGYSAAALAPRCRAAGWRVIGTTRGAEKAAAMRADGIEALIWPDPDTASDTGGLGEAIAATTHLLISAAPDGDRDPVLEGLGALIAARGKAIRWVGYLSTTGVYGDRAGGWVDEDDPLDAGTDRGRARVAAEQAWRTFAAEHGLALHIFRLAGIYGPGRGPFAKVRTGTAKRIIKPGQIFSRIHVDDIATVLEASIARPEAAPGATAIYNVCDDEPAPPEDVLAHAASLLGLPPPPEVSFEEAEMTPMARSFYAESKRVSNRRLKDRLGVTLNHPSYREGLAALLAAET